MNVDVEPGPSQNCHGAPVLETSEIAASHVTGKLKKVLLFEFM